MNPQDPHGVTSRWAHSARAGTLSSITWVLLGMLVFLTALNLLFR